MKRSELMHIMIEIDTMRVLSEDEHPGIVKLIEVFQNKKTTYLVMECVEGQTLQEWCLNSSKNAQYREQHALTLFQKITSALAHVHSRGIVHRDIKLENILLKRSEDPHTK